MSIIWRHMQTWNRFISGIDLPSPFKLLILHSNPHICQPSIQLSISKFLPIYVLALSGVVGAPVEVNRNASTVRPFALLHRVQVGQIKVTLKSRSIWTRKIISVSINQAYNEVCFHKLHSLCFFWAPRRWKTKYTEASKIGSWCMT